jgi:hypothetical protein
MINYELLSINNQLIMYKHGLQPTKESLYHNRTLAVTEANAPAYNFKFNILKYS